MPESVTSEDLLWLSHNWHPEKKEHRDWLVGSDRAQAILKNLGSGRGLLEAWAESLYECKANRCEAKGEFHLKDFRAAKPTLEFLNEED